MRLLDFPADLGPGALRWWLEPHAWTYESIFTRQRQVIELPAARWRATATWPVLGARRARRMSALLAQMRGPANALKLWPFVAPMPAEGGAGGGMVVSHNPDDAGDAVTCTGYVAGSTPLRMGDYVRVTTAAGGGQLVIVTADVVADGSGAALVRFEPPLRAAPALGAALMTAYAWAPMALVDTGQGEMDYKDSGLASTTLSFVEVL
jgi:hypothetical protein